MKKLIILILLFGLYSCNEKKIKGVWISVANEPINKGMTFHSNEYGFIIDFDNNKIGVIPYDSLMISFKINKAIGKIEIDNDTIDFKLNENEQLELKTYENTSTRFIQLNFNFDIKLTKEEIEYYLINGNFDPIFDNRKINFKKSRYWSDDSGYLKTLESKFIENDLIIGNWSIKKIRDNFFLFFNIYDMEDRNIYHIKEIDKDKIKLKPVYEISRFEGLTELKTSL